MIQKFHDHSDIFTVIMVHLSAIGITLLDVELALKLLSLITAIGYTVYRWYKEWKKDKKDEQNK